MRACPDTTLGHRTRALIVVLWRSGLRVSEALALEERDLNPRTGQIVVRHGKGDKRRIVGMDRFGWDELEAWLREREQFARGPVFCVLEGPTAGTRQWADNDVRLQLHKLAAKAGIRKRIAPHQFRHALAVDLVREGTRVDLLQKQLGHSNLGVTTTYLASVTADEVVSMAHDRRPPTVAVPDLMEALHV
jgi:site-specific recombinase XerD